MIEQVLSLEKLNHKAFGRIVCELTEPIWSGNLNWRCLLSLTRSDNALARSVGISALSLLDFERRELNAELMRLTSDNDQDVRVYAQEACELIRIRYQNRGLGDAWNDN